MKCPDPNAHDAHIWYELTTTKGGTIQVAHFCPGESKTLCKYDGHCFYWQTCLCGSEVSAQERRNEKYDFSHIHSVERG